MTTTRSLVLEGRHLGGRSGGRRTAKTASPRITTTSYDEIAILRIGPL
jgi:hypothetical protein